MKFEIRWGFALLVLAGFGSPSGAAPGRPEEAWLEELAAGHQLSALQMQEVRRVVAGSSRLGQGNPAVTLHPMSEAECRQRRAAAAQPGEAEQAREHAAICGAPHMAPLYDPARQLPTEASACIDIYEFPGLPCVYPVVWVQANEAAALCGAVGKRLCDAHEWEGACAGSLLVPDYPFELARGVPAATAVARWRAARKEAADSRIWAYGKTYRKGVCATGGNKTPGCNGGDFAGCGSNTYPSGAFPACRSPLGVDDLHGNVAEHMNLPLAAEQMASRGSALLGFTEMKGSWFIFDRYRAHEDACRWRAPFWHGSRVLDPASHRNYHLGFRCCKSLAMTVISEPKVPVAPSGARPAAPSGGGRF